MRDKKIKEKVEKYYDERVAQFSDEMLALKEKRMKPLYEKVLEFAKIDRQIIVAIIGSSTGSMPLFIAPRAKRVIGIDLSKESLSFAEKRTRQLGVTNIEHKKGDAEALPLEDNSVDVVLSDCVINLVPNKQKAFQEIYRILKADGILVMADPVRKKPLQETSDDLLTGCIAGTVAKEDYKQMLEKAGFGSIKITDITDLARKIWAEHEEKLDRYGLDYVIVNAIKVAKQKEVIENEERKTKTVNGRCC